jgi:NitT/TauT family transport system substrate-binding protein
VRQVTSPLNRRAFGIAVALTAAGVCSPVVAAAPRLGKSRISIAVGGKAALGFLPLTIAEQLGFFAAEGLDVEIGDHADDLRAQQAVTAGAADVVSGSYEQTISLQGKGQLFEAFVMQGRAPQIAMGLSTRSMPGARFPQELKGRRIGVASLGSSSHMVASLVLARAGLKEGEVSFLGVGTSTAAIAALRSGQIDAICNVDPVMTMLEQKGEVKIVSDTRTLKGTSDVFGGPMPAACLYAPLEFVQKNPAAAQALAHGIVHALKWLQTAGPGDIIRTVPESHLLGDRALYLASFAKVREAISLDGILPDDGARTALKTMAMVDASIKADRINLGRTYTNEFARKARDRFKA